MTIKSSSQTLNPAARKYVGDIATEYDEKRQLRPVTAADDKVIEGFLDGCEEDAVVIDMPCGTGRAAQAILERNQRYIGIDISKDMLDLCRSKIGSNQRATTLCADARNTGLEDGAGDYLICVKFIKWLPKDEMVVDALKEFRRITRKKMLVQVKILSGRNARRWQILSSLMRLDISAAMRGRAEPDESKSRSMSGGDFENLCRKSGLAIDDVIKNSIAENVRFYVLSRAG